MIAPSAQQAKYFVDLLDGNRCLLFIDDCFRDFDALNLVMRQKNICVIGFERDYAFEMRNFRLDLTDYKLIDISYITDEDAQSIIETIPKDMLRNNYKLDAFRRDKSVVTLIASVVTPMNYRLMERFSSDDRISSDIFLMICYVHACGVPCSFDMIYSYIGDDELSWQDMLDATYRIGNLISDCSTAWDFVNQIDSLQDYWQCRAKELARKVIENIPRGNKQFANMLMKFSERVLPYKICQYDLFMRNGYDADYASRAFVNSDEGERYYELCALRDESEYLYIQAAQYFSRRKEYTKAFEWIEKAKNIRWHNAFTVRSNYAYIHFSANMDVTTRSEEEEDARERELVIALNILRDCSINDKRKSIHVERLAECAIAYYEEYCDDERGAIHGNEFLEQAKTSINSELAANRLGDRKKWKLIGLLQKITEYLSALDLDSWSPEVWPPEEISAS
jgi:hypothetical protein